MFTVCIKPTEEGEFKVWVKQDAEAAPEGGAPGMTGADASAAPAAQGGMPPAAPAGSPAGPDMGGGDEDSGQTVPTVKQALTLALEALKNNGEMSDVNAQDRDFAEGFGGKPQEM